MDLATDKPSQLDLSRGDNSLPNLKGILSGRQPHQVLGIRRGNRDLDVYPIEHRTRNSLAVSPDRIRQTSAFPLRIHGIAARAGIHRGAHHEPGRPRNRSARPADSDYSVFHRLAERFQDIPVEFRKFVQEKDSIMGKARFAGPKPRTSADKGYHRRRMVRRAKRSKIQESFRFFFAKNPQGRIDAHAFQNFFIGHRR